MEVKLHTRIKKRLWLGHAITNGNPIYVNVLYTDKDYTSNIINVFTTELGEVWEIK